MLPCLRHFFTLRALCVVLLLLLFGANSFIFSFPKIAHAQNFLPTTVEVLVACGNGIIEEINFEVCDKGDPPETPVDVGTSTCANFDDIFGNPFISGDLGCADDCLSYDIEPCYSCGNTYKEEAEECDTNDFGGAFCSSFGYSKGSLICTEYCEISTANCEAMEDEGGLPGGGGSGSGGAPANRTGDNPGDLMEDETKVIIRGKSYPNSDVHILVDGVVIGIVSSDAKADFYFESAEIVSGVNSFGFWSEDKDGLKSVLLSLTFRVISGAVTTISGVYLSPSIDIDKSSVRQGEYVQIYGQTVPGTEVHIYIHSDEEFIEQTSSEESGDWVLTFNTTPLEEDFHIAKALFQVETDGNIIKSGFSRSISFYVGKVGGEVPCPEADLNHDDRVNLTDFSILLYYWGTDNTCADQNQNGNVELIDFSIMMYYWTG